MKEPRVITIVKKYHEGNLEKVYEYLSDKDMCINPNSWAGNIKSLIEDKMYTTARKYIELVSYNLNYEFYKKMKK